MRSVQRSLCAAMLALQAVVLFLSGLVLTGVTELSFGKAFGIGAGLAALCLVAAGTLSRAWGYAIGWLVQAVSLGLGFAVTPMFFLGAVFAALWATAYFMGARIDQEKALRARAHDEVDQPGQ